MKYIIVVTAILVFSKTSYAETGFTRKFNVNLDLVGGVYSSKGDASWTFTNGSAFPSLASGEKLPLNNEKGKASGIQAGMGFRWNDWFSWNALLLLLRSEGENYTHRTANGTTHNIKLETSMFYVSPFIWTFYPLPFLYVQAGAGLMVEGNKVTTDIPNGTSFETGTGGAAGNMGVGIEVPVGGEMFTLRAGLSFIGATLKAQEYKGNQGTTNEFTANLEERKVGITLLTVGTKIYF